MDNVKPNLDGGSSFAAYFAEGDIESCITVSEDGRITIVGILDGREAVHLLRKAAFTIEEYVQRRALPPTIEPLPLDDPAKARGRAFDDLPPRDNDDIPF